MQTLEIEWRHPSTLIPYVKNAKIHTAEQVDKIAGQIHSFGFDRPIVVDKNGVIIKGHGRREAALKLNLEKVPVIVSTLDEYQAMAARIGDNKVSESTWDPELLKFDIGTLKLQDFDLKLTGFDTGSIDKFLETETAETQFTENDRKSVSERKEDYEASDMRQIILVTDPETFESIMGEFAELQETFGVETNLEVIQQLMEFYAANRIEENGPEESVQEMSAGE